MIEQQTDAPGRLQAHLEFEYQFIGKNRNEIWIVARDSELTPANPHAGPQGRQLPRIAIISKAEHLAPDGSAGSSHGSERMVVAVKPNPTMA